MPESRPPSLPQQMSLRFPDAVVRGEREVEVPCSACGQRLKVPRWYAQQGLRLHFCGASCRTRWQAEAEQEGQIILDGRPDYRGGDWEVQARRVRERDGYTCQVCGVTERELCKQLDVHHILPFRLFKSNLEANRPDNLISVCHACHMRLEAEGYEALPLFKAQGRGTAHG